MAEAEPAGTVTWVEIAIGLASAVATVAGTVIAWRTLQRTGLISTKLKVGGASLSADASLIKVNARNKSEHPLTILGLRLLDRGEETPVKIRATNDPNQLFGPTNEYTLAPGDSLIACLYPTGSSETLPPGDYSVRFVLGGADDVTRRVKQSAKILLPNDCRGG